MTYVIITAGIDLSVGACARLQRRRRRPRRCTHAGGNNWGVIILGLVVALAGGLAWGLVNGFLVAKAKIPAFIVTLGTLGHEPRRARSSSPAASTSARSRSSSSPRSGPAAPFEPGPLARDHRLRGGDRLRRHPRRHALRPLHVRGRLQRGGGAARRRRRRPPPDQGLRAGRDARRAWPASCRWRASRRPRSAATTPTTCRPSPPS